MNSIDITPEVLLKAYACGIFPMAESADDPALFWIEPEKRGVIPLDRFHVPARLSRTVRSDRFIVTVDRRLRCRPGRLCTTLGRSSADLDQCPHSPALSEALRAPPLP